MYPIYRSVHSCQTIWCLHAGIRSKAMLSLMGWLHHGSIKKCKAFPSEWAHWWLSGALIYQNTKKFHSNTMVKAGMNSGG